MTRKRMGVLAIGSVLACVATAGAQTVLKAGTTPSKAKPVASTALLPAPPAPASATPDPRIDRVKALAAKFPALLAAASTPMIRAGLEIRTGIKTQLGEWPVGQWEGSVVLRGSPATTLGKTGIGLSPATAIGTARPGVTNPQTDPMKAAATPSTRPAGNPLLMAEEGTTTTITSTDTHAENSDGSRTSTSTVEVKGSDGSYFTHTISETTDKEGKTTTKQDVVSVDKNGKREEEHSTTTTAASGAKSTPKPEGASSCSSNACTNLMVFAKALTRNQVRVKTVQQRPLSMPSEPGSAQPQGSVDPKKGKIEKLNTLILTDKRSTSGTPAPSSSSPSRVNHGLIIPTRTGGGSPKPPPPAP